jgi:hypothetical protein
VFAVKLPRMPEFGRAGHVDFRHAVATVGYALAVLVFGIKIVVIGGTRLIGSKVVEKLRGHGHEAVAASPKNRGRYNYG